MASIRGLCLCVLISSAAAGGDGSAGRDVAFALEYFSAKSVRMVTSVLCRHETNVWLHKRFSRRGIPFDCLDATTSNESAIEERLSSKFFKLGVLLDLTCPRATELLLLADRRRLLSFGRSLASWLVVTKAHVSREALDASIQSYVPEVDDPFAFLAGPYRDRKNEEHLLEINAKVNLELIKSYAARPPRPTPAPPSFRNKTELDFLWPMKITLDTEMTLAVPGLEGSGVSYDLYDAYKATHESRPRTRKAGEVTTAHGEADLRLLPGESRRDLEGGLLRAVSAIFQPEAFTTIDDLATRESDLWSKMSYEHVRLLAEDLNFRIMVRFFDDYGWQTNGTFGHLMGHMQEKKADLSAACLIMRTDRFGVVQFLQCPFRLQTGILFREPSLSSVSNIFLLPFSRGIWISIGAVILLTVSVLRCRGIFGKTLLGHDGNGSDLLEVGEYVVGAICQQGFSTTPRSLPERISVVVLLLTSLALFTSYSACIVALLQSSSSAISSIGDITRSNLEVGIQANFPFYRVLIKEAVHPVLKEFYDRKVLAKGEKAYCDRREGIEKMRTGMFAFEVELTAGYKLISETYEEREKCGIKEIDLVPKPFICVAVQKFSPFKEVFTQRLARQNEAGLFDRSWKLWVDQKPKCEVGRIGFISVGLTEFRAALQVFAYGVVAAAACLVLELLRERKRLAGRLKQAQAPESNRERRGAAAGTAKLTARGSDPGRRTILGSGRDERSDAEAFGGNAADGRGRGMEELEVRMEK